MNNCCFLVGTRVLWEGLTQGITQTQKLSFLTGGELSAGWNNFTCSSQSQVTTAVL